MKNIGIGMSVENKEERDIVKFCKNCYGLEPCLCEKHDYIKTWDFVYWLFKKCKM
jgi:hypothetical protein